MKRWGQTQDPNEASASINSNRLAHAPPFAADSAVFHQPLVDCVVFTSREAKTMPQIRITELQEGAGLLHFGLGTSVGA